MDNKVEVTVICLTYNHEKSIARTLESLIGQNTNFSYEIIVHDDASSDDTPIIIQKYEKLYPNLIYPILQTENQYSQNVSIVKTFIDSKIHGKYVALCEGDDYWTDINKLQIQYDYMETHSECSMCTHNTIIHNLITGVDDSLFNKYTKKFTLSIYDVVFKWIVHTSSYFVRKDAYDYESVFPMVWCGDYAHLLYAFSKGKIVCLPNVMSVYNCNNVSGSTWKNRDYECGKKRLKLRNDFLVDYDKYSDYSYTKIINMRIAIDDIEYYYLDLLMKFVDSGCLYVSYRQYSINILRMKEFKYSIKKLPFFVKIRKLLPFISYGMFLIKNKLFEKV